MVKLYPNQFYNDVCYKGNTVLIGPRRQKTCLQGFANNTGADQPMHPLSLISAFVIPFFGKFHI